MSTRPQGDDADARLMRQTIFVLATISHRHPVVGFFAVRIYLAVAAAVWSWDNSRDRLLVARALSLTLD